MAIEGGCYCGAVRYAAEGDAAMKAQCFCRECQYITGGSPLLTFGVPTDAFKIASGELKDFARDDLEGPVTRQFCPNCGTHIASIAMPGMVLVKTGTLDDRTHFDGPQMAIFTCDAAAYHQVPTDIPTFEKMPS